MYSKAHQRQLFDLSRQLLAKTAQLSLFSSDEVEELLRQLREVIVYHEWRYYVLNDPVLSDFEYDQLYKRLEALEAEKPELITPDSPTQRVSSDLSADFPSVPHLSPMLSLANSYNAEDLKDFDTQIKKLALLEESEEVEYAVEPKFDGGTLTLVFENDQLQRAATRGNGVMGEEMTHNARTIRSIPLKAAFSDRNIQKVELRGEAIIRKENFVKINEKRAEEGLPLFANPRNAATGGLRMKDPSETAKRGLEAFVFQISYAEGNKEEGMLDLFSSHSEIIDYLGSHGFKIPRKGFKKCKGIQEVVDFCMQWQEHREEYPYEIDGMVVKVNSLALQEKCGYTSHHPRWAIAFKFKAKQATTKLKTVDFQVGKIGSITPVAKVEPVQLAGVTISSISLHNEDFINSKDIRIGDTVLVERAGDVIPYIVKAMDEMRDGTEKVIEFPTNCPVCHTPLVKSEEEAAWRCVNYSCEAQVRQRMIHHVSKDAMDIEGFGKANVERFHQMGWLQRLPDIYRLDYDKIAELEGFGKRSATNLQAAIEKAKKNPIRRLLYSLSIQHLGKKVSKLIAAELPHVLKLKDWTLEDFTLIKDIGPIVAENVIAFFQNPKNVELLAELEKLGVNLTQTEDDLPVQVSEDAPLAGKTILFTGSLQTMSRKEAQAKAEAAGARNISAVSSKLNILVAGEKAGSKLKKAKALGTVEIMTEEDFLELLTS